MERKARYFFFSWFRAALVGDRHNRADRTGEYAIAGNSVSGADPDLRLIPRHVQAAANTYIFSLAPIRTKLGNHWQEFSPSVHRIANRLVFRKLDGRATVERYGDVYVLSFGRLKGRRAQAEGDRLFRQFMELLTKGVGPETIGVRGRRTKRRRKRKRGPFQFLKSYFTGKTGTEPAVHSLGDAAAASPIAKPADDSDAPTGPFPADSAGAPGVGALGKRSVSERVARPIEARDYKAVSQTPQHDTHSPDRRTSRFESRSIENAMALSIRRRQSEWAAAMASHNFPPPDLTFIYRSMWNFGKRQLTTYSAVPMCWKNGFEFYYGEDVVPPPRRPSALFELDLLSLGNAIEMLDFLVKERREVLFLNAVHASSLVDKEMLAEYMALVESVPDAHRRQLIFEIVDIADYVHRPDAAQMVNTLSPYALAISASVSLEDRNFTFWKQCGFTAIGANVARDGRPEAKIFGNLEQFVAQARQVRLLTYLRGLGKPSLTISAAGAGFNFLEGPVVGRSDDQEHVARAKFDIENLFDDIWAVDTADAVGS